MKNGRFGWMAATVFLGACGPAKDAADAGAAGGSTGGQADVGSGGSSGGSGGAVGGGSGGSGGATGGATGGSGGATGGSGGAAGGSGGATGGSGGATGGSGGATGGTTGGSGGATGGTTGGSGGATGGSGGATGGSGGAAGGSGGAAGGAAGGAGGAAGGAGGSAGGAGGAGGAEPPEAPISLRVLNVDIPDGGEYFEPLNEGNARVPLFSFYTDVYTLTNHSDAPVTIDSVEIVPAVGVYPEEFELRNCLLPEGPQVIRDQAMDAGADLSFDLCFSPVGGDLEAPEDEQYGCAEDTDCDCLGGGVDCPPKLYRGGYCLAGFCSASRRAEVVITYDGGRTYTFTAAGRGRPREVASLTHGTPTWEYSIGAPTTDELTGGMAADPDGNVFFTSNVPQVINVFANDILIGRVNADGSFAWLKAWSGKYQDTSPDSGQNGETGGTAGSIVRGPDGSIYVVGYHSNTNSNSGGFLVVLKIDPNDGALIWHKVWGGDPLVQGSGGASGYAIDVQGDRVYVTGEQRGVIFLSLNAGDGSLIYEHTLDLAPGSVSRGYAIRADAAGNVYLGGLVNGRGFVARVTGGNTDNPAVQWVKRVNMGIGSNINHIDIDAAGNAYLSLDRRGANTAFGAISVNPQGEFRWAKTYHPAGQGDRENTHVVRVVGDSVYVGGRVGFGQFDTSAGDGLLVKASLADGAMEWTGIYYTGTALEDIAETRVKGIAVVGEDLLIANQHYTGPNNSNHYFGYWYDGTRRPGDPNDSRAFDWLNYCPRGDANCVHGRPDRPDCLPDYECDFIYEDIPGIAFGTPANQLLLDADTAFGLDRNIPPNRVPSFNAYIDLSTQQVVQLEGSVGAPCGTGVGDCGIICSELDDATCQAGGARDTCTRIPRFGDFAWCESKRGTPTHKALRTAAGLGGDGEVFLTKIRLR